MPQLRSGRIMSMKILFKNNHLSFENPRVTGSIPVSATNKIKLTAMWAFFTSIGFELTSLKVNLMCGNKKVFANNLLSGFHII
jgi:hypothetical protein